LNEWSFGFRQDQRMALRHPQQTWSISAYLDFDKTSDVRHEYWDGAIYAMAGASSNHGVLTSAAVAMILPQLPDRCNIYSSDMKVRAAERFFLYPDVVITCDPIFMDTTTTVLLNPLLVIEVLSPSTMAYDRGDKLDLYRSIPALQAYLLLWQDRVRAELYVRIAADRWQTQVYQTLSDVIEIPQVSCQLSLAKLYLRVVFGASTDTPPSDEA
jgi:Uma2 family endonuclease